MDSTRQIGSTPEHLLELVGERYERLDGRSSSAAKKADAAFEVGQPPSNRARVMLDWCGKTQVRDLGLFPVRLPDARGWVTAPGGVAAEQQMLALTVQGTGKATVVLDEPHVRVVDKSAPLAWNDFAMGVGCGGGVETTSLGVDIVAGRPALSPKAGQRDFPAVTSGAPYASTTTASPSGRAGTWDGPPTPTRSVPPSGG